MVKNFRYKNVPWQPVCCVTNQRPSFLASTQPAPARPGGGGGSGERAMGLCVPVVPRRAAASGPQPRPGAGRGSASEPQLWLALRSARSPRCCPLFICGLCRLTPRYIIKILMEKRNRILLVVDQIMVFAQLGLSQCCYVASLHSTTEKKRAEISGSKFYVVENLCRG